MAELTWEQALAWRLGRHWLDARAPRAGLHEVVAGVCGAHAQLLSSAELSLWARLDGLARGEVESLLWEDRSLVKTWAMRGTLHLLPSDEYPVWQGALSAYRHYLRPSWLRAFGVTEAELEALLPAIGRVLDGALLTRDELADAVAEDVGDPGLASKLGGDSWGALLKPASFRGYLCFGPGQQRNVRFTAPRSWLGPFEPVAPDEALAAMTRRYLRAYAPASREDYARWCAHSPAQAGRMIRALGDEAVEVSVEGTPYWMLAEDAAEAGAAARAQGAAPRGVARLLPAFDPWVIGASRDVDALCAAPFRERVYRQQGWISPVVIVDGRMAGVWGHEAKGGRVAVEVEPFEPLLGWAREQVADEAARLAAFLDGDLDLSWA